MTADAPAPLLDVRDLECTSRSAGRSRAGSWAEAVGL